MKSKLILLAWAQAVLYVAAGVWPLVSMSIFEAVTGPKTDDWLVKTVGTLIIVIGGVLGVAAARRNVTFEVFILAVGAAFGLTIIDVVYVAERVISPIYLLDAVAEVLLIVLWVVLWKVAQRESTTDSTYST